MSKNKRINFSTIISPRFSPLLLLNMNQTQRLTPNKMTTTHSPLRLSPIIADLQSITEYRKTSKLKLNKETMDKINYALTIEEISQKKTEERIKNKEFYMTYKINPFIEIDKKKKEDKQALMKKDHHDKQSDKQQLKKEKNIIQGLNNLREKSNFEQIMNRLKKIDMNMNRIHSKIKDEKIKTKFDYKDKENEMKQSQARKLSELFFDKSPFDELDEIVSMKDQSYFKKKMHQQTINIFKVHFQQKETNKYSGPAFLEQYRFSQDSIVNKTQTKDIFDVVRDLSSFGRIMMINSKSKKIPKDQIISEYDILFTLENLSMRQLMLVCKGQITPQILLKWMNQQEKTKHVKREKSESESEEKQTNEIDYEENQRNRQDNYTFDKIVKTQIQYFKALPFTRIQQHQDNLSKTIMQDFKKISIKQQQCISNSIFDRQIIKSLLDKKDKILQNQLLTNADYRNSLEFSKEMEKKIRSNKLSKNRAEKIKVDLLTQTFKLKKESQSKFKSRSQPKRLNTTWK